MNTNEKSRRWKRVVVSAVMVLVLGSAVFALGSLDLPFQPSETQQVVLLYALSTLVVLSLLIFMLILSRNFLKLLAERRQQAMGSKFKTKLVMGALGISLLPVVFMFFLSYAFLNRSLAKWFPRPLEIVRDEAERLLAESEEHERTLLFESAQTLAGFLAATAQTPVEIERAFHERSSPYQGLDCVALLDSNGRLVTAAGRAEGKLGELSRLVAERAAEREMFWGGRTYRVARAAIENRGRTRGWVLVAQQVPEEFTRRKAAIEQQAANYVELSAGLRLYRYQMTLVLLLFTLLVLFAATWFALFLSRQVTVPIVALAEATRQVSRGDFDHRVTVEARDELANLVESFNQMTSQLGESSRQIAATNLSLQTAIRQLEERQQLIETLLESIPTGVISLDKQKNILRTNSAVARVLGLTEVPRARRLNELFEEGVVTQLTELLRKSSRAGSASAEVELQRASGVAHIAVTVSALPKGGQDYGYVVVLEDLTELLRGQKAAVWQEVAQRIAHEIKNPLTPIQLSAERLRRYLERLPDTGGNADPQLTQMVAECVTLIGQEAGALKGLIEEFSEFARFPAANVVPSDLNAVVQSALGVFENRHNGIAVRTALSELPPIHLDPELFRRVLVNLMDNAAEAMERSPVSELRIETRLDVPREAVESVVADTGHGIPPEDKAKLFLPYFSKKGRGTGLGLAIVQRIVADHNGTIRVEDNQPFGARFIIQLPI